MSRLPTALWDQADSFSQGVKERATDAARVSRFLWGRARFVPRHDDIFISSYPRSGTTWLQQVLRVLSHDGDPGSAHIASTVPWFERSLSLGQRSATTFETLASPRIFKSHLPWLWLPRGTRYVYAQRDGRDVLVSYFHLYRSHLGFEGDFDQFFERFITGDLQYRSWFKHIAGWKRVAARPDVMVVRYEDMLSDLPAVMAALNRFLSLGRSAARISALVEYCTFSYMKAHEARFDHATADSPSALSSSSGDFVRRGQVGGFRDYLSESQIKCFEQRSAAPIARPELEFDLPAFLH